MNSRMPTVSSRRVEITLQSKDPAFLPGKMSRYSFSSGNSTQKCSKGKECRRKSTKSRISSTFSVMSTKSSHQSWRHHFNIMTSTYSIFLISVTAGPHADGPFSTFYMFDKKKPLLKVAWERQSRNCGRLEQVWCPLHSTRVGRAGSEVGTVSNVYSIYKNKYWLLTPHQIILLSRHNISLAPIFLWDLSLFDLVQSVMNYVKKTELKHKVSVLQAQTKETALDRPSSNLTKYTSLATFIYYDCIVKLLQWSPGRHKLIKYQREQKRWAHELGVTVSMIPPYSHTTLRSLSHCSCLRMAASRAPLFLFSFPLNHFTILAIICWTGISSCNG